jgi:spore coat polysaccharide biosynthesis protein SpsF
MSRRVQPFASGEATRPKTVAIIQARMGSSRLPGKVLLDLAGRSVLERIVRRVQRCRLVDEIVVATTTAAADNGIADACRRIGVSTFRGSEDDVLERFVKAARAHLAEICVRITADCPLIDPEVSDEIIRRFMQASPPVDYASNKIPQSFPRGLDTEVFSCAALERAAREATLPYERAHVTVYIYEHPQRFNLLSVVSDTDRADWRWTLDTAEDLEFLREIYVRLGADNEFSWHDVIHLLEREPGLRRINQHVVQKAVREG